MNPEPAKAEHPKTRKGAVTSDALPYFRDKKYFKSLCKFTFQKLKCFHYFTKKKSTFSPMVVICFMVTFKDTFHWPHSNLSISPNFIPFLCYRLPYIHHHRDYESVFNIIPYLASKNLECKNLQQVCIYPISEHLEDSERERLWY